MWKPQKTDLVVVASDDELQIAILWGTGGEDQTTIQYYPQGHWNLLRNYLNPESPVTEMQSPHFIYKNKDWRDRITEFDTRKLSHSHSEMYRDIIYHTWEDAKEIDLRRDTILDHE